MKWVLFVAGVVATLYFWQVRQPETTADFTLFYRSAAMPADRMYERPPGPPRNNMNPPHFQLLLRPLTAVSLPTATAIFRALSIVCLIGCVWVIAAASRERWDVGDIGALLIWTPMATMLSLNQITWILWPLLVAAWQLWRRDRWIAGAIVYGVALSFKPFLGVLWLWLVITRRWGAAIATGAAAAFTAGLGIAVYGVDVFRAWLDAVANVQWWVSAMNASLMGCLARGFTAPDAQTLDLPRIVSPLTTVGSVVLVAITLIWTRRRSIDDSWASLMAVSLMASPLGWVYYAWWLFPADRPSRLLFQAPMLWLPLAVVIMPKGANRILAATLGSAYFWGLVSIWAASLWSLRHKPTEQPTP